MSTTMRSKKLKSLPRRKKGGYDARVEQWLYENPEHIILITNAGKDGVNYIQYTINCGVCRRTIKVV